jgi:hypothetical protein
VAKILTILEILLEHLLFSTSSILNLTPCKQPTGFLGVHAGLDCELIRSCVLTSMASVCGGCLAMMDAGVPLKGSVAGVAMGLILNTREWGGDGDPVILSDILGSEDALGDMDFKVHLVWICHCTLLCSNQAWHQ